MDHIMCEMKLYTFSNMLMTNEQQQMTTQKLFTVKYAFGLKP